MAPELDRDAIEATVFAYLRERLKLDVPGTETPLLSSGLVDSGNLVRMATHLERVVSVSIPDRDIDGDHFDTVSMIVDYLQRKLR